MNVEQLSMGNVLSDKSLSHTKKVQKYQEKKIKQEKYIKPVYNHFVRTKYGDISKIDRVKKEARSIFVGYTNAHDRDGNGYTNRLRKQVYDVFVRKDKKGKFYDYRLYNENIIYQSEFIVDCFINGDIIRLKNGSQGVVIGYKKGKIIEEETFKNDKNKIQKNYKRKTTTILYCVCNGKTINVANDDILGIEYTPSDIDLLNGGDLVYTVFQGHCVVLKAYEDRLLVKQLFINDGKQLEVFIEKNDVLNIEYTQED